GMATRSPVRIAGFDHPGPRKTLPGINRKAQGFIPGAPTGSPQRERDGGQAAPWKAAGSPSSRAGCATVQPVLPAPSVLPKIGRASCREREWMSVSGVVETESEDVSDKDA